MPSSGSGTLTPITVPAGGANLPSLALPEGWPNCAVTLSDYQKFVGYDEPAFWGVVYDGQQDLSCNVLWTSQQRSMLANALAEAESLFEGIINYPLCPKWITDIQTIHCNPFMTKYGKLITMGKRATSTIAAGEPISFTTEPATVGPLPTSITDIEEVRFFIQGTEQEVYPTKVTLAGGFLTAEFPRSRLVLPNYDTLQDWTGNSFTDLVNFAGELDVMRYYTDATQSAALLEHSTQCVITSQPLCAVIVHAETGSVKAFRNCLTSPSPFVCTSTHGIELYYKAGLRTLEPKIMSAVIRLAHTLLPTSICNQCDQIHRLWEADNKIPPVLTRERINCPFGLSDGAWFAYKRAQQVKMIRMLSF